MTPDWIGGRNGMPNWIGTIIDEVVRRVYVVRRRLRSAITTAYRMISKV